MKHRKFVETARVFASGGRGGNGCASFRREKFVPRGGPDGGDGGDGGCVIFHADRNLDSLVAVSYHPHSQASNGEHGKGNKLRGRNGKDLVLNVPCGTEIRKDSDDVPLGDLVEDGARLIVARGGRGGQGNGSWKRGSARSIDECTPGEPGEQIQVRLELKIVADAVLVGFPNSGKSSLLSVLSRARPKIASYPFTTLHPVIGTVQSESFSNLAVLELPGLVKNAHRGAGLGNKFLRHIERARLLVFVIDMSGADGRNPAEDYFVLLNELRMHDQKPAELPSLIAANKADLPETQRHFAEFERITGRSPLLVSAASQQGIDKLKQAMYDSVEGIRGSV